MLLGRIPTAPFLKINATRHSARQIGIGRHCWNSNGHRQPLRAAKVPGYMRNALMQAPLQPLSTDTDPPNSSRVADSDYKSSTCAILTAGANRVRIRTMGGVDFELPAVTTAWWLTHLLQNSPLLLSVANGNTMRDLRIIRPDFARHDLTTHDAICALDGRLIAHIEVI